MNSFARLVSYGCSHMYNGTAANDDWHSEQGIPWLIANHYNLSLDNRAQIGTNNTEILTKIIHDIETNNFKDTDLVLIQWTYTTRYRWIERGSIMPLHAYDYPEVAWVYENMYDERDEILKTALFSIELSNMIPNLLISFTDGKDVLANSLPTTVHRKLFSNTRLILYFDKSLPLQMKDDIGTDALHPCYHLNELGNAIAAKKYIENIDRYYQ